MEIREGTEFRELKARKPKSCHIYCVAISTDAVHCASSGTAKHQPKPWEKSFLDERNKKTEYENRLWLTLLPYCRCHGWVRLPRTDRPGRATADQVRAPGRGQEAALLCTQALPPGLPRASTEHGEETSPSITISVHLRSGFSSYHQGFHVSLHSNSNPHYVKLPPQTHGQAHPLENPNSKCSNIINILSANTTLSCSIRFWST